MLPIDNSWVDDLSIENQAGHKIQKLLFKDKLHTWAPALKNFLFNVKETFL